MPGNAGGDEPLPTRANLLDFVPFRPPPGSDLVLLMSAWCAAGLVSVDAGQPILRPPLIGERSTGAPAYEHLLADRAAVQSRSSWTAQPGMLDYDPAGLEARIERWRDDQGPWHPGRHVTVCLDASLMRRIAGHSYRSIGEQAGAGYEAAKEWVAKGDLDWFDLAAWPWCSFPRGELPDDWHDHDSAWLALERVWRTSMSESRLTRLWLEDGLRRQARELHELADWLSRDEINPPPTR